MQKSIIVEKDVEDAIDWLKSNENKCAEHRANRRYLEDFGLEHLWDLAME